MEYIDTPCPCSEGDDCQHYGRKLVGRLWKLSRMENDLGRSYRQLWSNQVAAKNGTPPANPKISTTIKAKGCGCKGAVSKEPDISCLVPSRKRSDKLLRLLNSLNEQATNPLAVEILVALDQDDEAPKPLPPNVKVYTRDQMDNLSAYFNWLASFAKGKWFFVLNDDATMTTKAWDSKIRLHMGSAWYGITSPSGINESYPYAEFPVIAREGMAKLGWLMPECYPGYKADSYLYRLYSAAGKVARLDIALDHERQEDDTRRAMERRQEKGEHFDDDVTRLRQ